MLQKGDVIRFYESGSDETFIVRVVQILAERPRGWMIRTEILDAAWRKFDVGFEACFFLLRASVRECKPFPHQLAQEK